MSDTIKVDWANLPKLFEAMEQVRDQATPLGVYFQNDVCNKSGFAYSTCALEPLGDFMPTLQGWWWQMETEFTTHWNALRDAIATSAQAFDKVDGGIAHDLRQYFGEIPINSDGTIGPVAHPDVADYDIVDVQGALSAPPDGGDQLSGHDQDWQTVSTGYDDIRDGINDIVGKINDWTGLGMPKLPEKSLEDYIVYPLSGNYKRIQANAAACTILDTGMQTWGGNFTKIAEKTNTALEGKAGLALAGQMELYDLLMNTIGGVVGRGKVVWDDIAKMSERIAIQVEKAIIVLGKTLGKLLAKLSERVSSWLGWLSTAFDVIKKGTHAFDDIVNDVQECIHIIHEAFNLVDTIKAWAQQQADRLRDFKDLVDTVNKLPSVSSIHSLGDLEKVDLTQVRKTLSEVRNDFGPGSGQQTTDVTNAVNGLVTDAQSGKH